MFTLYAFNIAQFTTCTDHRDRYETSCCEETEPYISGEDQASVCGDCIPKFQSVDLLKSIDGKVINVATFATGGGATVISNNQAINGYYASGIWIKFHVHDFEVTAEMLEGPYLHKMVTSDGHAQTTTFDGSFPESLRTLKVNVDKQSAYGGITWDFWNFDRRWPGSLHAQQQKRLQYVRNKPRAPFTIRRTEQYVSHEQLNIGVGYNLGFKQGGEWNLKIGEPDANQESKFTVRTNIPHTMAVGTIFMAGSYHYSNRTVKSDNAHTWDRIWPGLIFRASNESQGFGYHSVHTGIYAQDFNKGCMWTSVTGSVGDMMNGACDQVVAEVNGDYEFSFMVKNKKSLAGEYDILDANYISGYDETEYKRFFPRNKVYQSSDPSSPNYRPLEQPGVLEEISLALSPSTHADAPHIGVFVRVSLDSQVLALDSKYHLEVPPYNSYHEEMLFDSAGCLSPYNKGHNLGAADALPRNDMDICPGMVESFDPTQWDNEWGSPQASSYGGWMEMGIQNYPNNVGPYGKKQPNMNISVSYSPLDDDEHLRVKQLNDDHFHIYPEMWKSTTASTTSARRRASAKTDDERKIPEEFI